MNARKRVLVEEQVLELKPACRGGSFFRFEANEKRTGSGVGRVSKVTDLALYGLPPLP